RGGGAYRGPRPPRSRAGPIRAGRGRPSWTTGKSFAHHLGPEANPGRSSRGNPPPRAGARRSELQLDITAGHGHAGLDPLPRTVIGTVTEITHMTFLEAHHAGLADTHPAAEGHLDADLLTALQDRGGTVEFHGPAGGPERQRSPGRARIAVDREPLHIQIVPAGRLEVSRELVQHRRGAARPRRPLRPIWDQSGHLLGVDAPLLAGHPQVQGVPGLGALE